MSKIAIRIKNASKYYKLYHEPKDRLKEALHPFGKSYHKPFYALNDINLDIQSGEIVGIVGRNGSGKSTLLKLITGVLTPNSGTVTANGKISALLELGAGFNPEFSGLQNIYFYGTVLGLSKQEIAERLDDIIAFAEIGDFIEQPIKTYSSGMKSRLGFAVAVHIDPEILILDEVLSVGDVLFRRKCYAKMEEFFKGGKTIIYVSHDANSIQALCTRAIFLDSGSILLDGDAKTVMTYYQKYLFAKDENKTKVKDEIMQLKEQGLQAVKHNQFQEDAEGEINVEMEELQTEDEEYFIPDLIPKSTVEYKNYPVEIFDTCIKNNRRSKVNVLKMNRDYYFSAKIKFDVDAEKVGFSFTIKNEKGMNISSCKTLETDYTDARKDSIYQVEWHFINKLLPGIYYMNIGLRSFPEGKESFILNRIIDVFVFKVNQDRVINIGGIVALDQKMKIAEIENTD